MKTELCVVDTSLIERVYSTDSDRALQVHNMDRNAELWYCLFLRIRDIPDLRKFKTGVDSVIRMFNGIPSQVYKGVLYARAPVSNTLKKEIHKYLADSKIPSENIRASEDFYCKLISREYVREMIDMLSE